MLLFSAKIISHSFWFFFLFECSVTESEPEGTLERIHIHYCSSVLIMVTAPLNGSVYFSVHLFSSAVTRAIFMIPPRAILSPWLAFGRATLILLPFLWGSWARSLTSLHVNSSKQQRWFTSALKICSSVGNEINLGCKHRFKHKWGWNPCCSRKLVVRSRVKCYKNFSTHWLH